MSQHGYMRHTATPPLVLDLIRLIQSASCGSIITFTLLLSKTKLFGLHFRRRQRARLTSNILMWPRSYRFRRDNAK